MPSLLHCFLFDGTETYGQFSAVRVVFLSIFKELQAPTEIGIPMYYCINLLSLYPRFFTNLIVIGCNVSRPDQTASSARRPKRRKFS